MKATLIAAAFLIPTLVLAGDPQPKESYEPKEQGSTPQTQQQTLTPTQVLTELHMVSQTGIEQATIAQSNAGSERVKSFAEKQVKDFQKLDKAVLDLAKDRNITLSMESAPGSTEKKMGSETMPSEPPGGTAGTGSGTTGTTTGTDTRSGAVGSGTTGGTGTTTQMGTAGDTRTGTATEVPDTPSPSAEPQPAPAPETMGSAAGTVDPKAKDSRWERLKTLKGSEFDTEYLSMINENARQNISNLESNRIKGDRKIDKLIDSAVKTFKDHQKQVEKLQRDIRAS